MGSTDDPISQEERIRHILSWPLVRASIMTMAGEQLGQAFDISFQDPYKVRRRFLARLEELCEQGTSSAAHVRRLIERIEESTSALPIPKQRSADSTIGLLVLMLEHDEQLPYAREFLLHPRRSRRAVGHKIVRRNRGAGLGPSALESYRLYRSREGLITLLLMGQDVADLIPSLDEALQDLRDRYYQARLFEQVLARDEPSALALAPKFPMAFIWGVGRQRNRAGMAFIIDELEAGIRTVQVSPIGDQAALRLSSDIPLLVWALERLGATDYLSALAKKWRIDAPWLTTVLDH